MPKKKYPKGKSKNDTKKYIKVILFESEKNNLESNSSDEHNDIKK